MKWESVSDIGKVRDLNEDYAVGKQIADPPCILGIVCDGLGGCLAGEVASKEAAEAMKDYFLAGFKKLEDPLSGDSVRNLMLEAVQAANEKVWELSSEVDEYTGMGTTLTSVWADEQQAVWVSVGDSRGYVFREGTLEQVTEDQSYVWDLYREGMITKEQMVEHPMNHLLNVAVGSKEKLYEQDICIRSTELSSGDIIMLCSDGLTDVIYDSELEEILTAHDDLERCCREMVDQANSRSGKDNITILLIRA